MTTAWHALTVKPKHERTAALALQTKGLETFVPLYRSRRRWSDRIKELELPLFAGYVFCRFTSADRARILATPSVNSVVSFGNRPAPVSETEIQTVRTMVSSGLPIGPWPFLNVGERVRIDSGPLCGVEGILTQVKDAWRVVVSIELLQRSIAAEVDRDVLSVVSRIAPQKALHAKQAAATRSTNASI
jgi:transcription antitermination factor NusG